MKTWEVYQMLDNDPKTEFKRRGEEGVYCVPTGKWVFGRKGGGAYAPLRIDDEWELILEPVDFMTAINSGKRIKPAEHDKWIYYVPAISALKAIAYEYEEEILTLLNGKWLIEP